MSKLSQINEVLDGKKTLLYAAINIILSIIPQAREWMIANPELAMQINAALVALLRIATKRPIKK